MIRECEKLMDNEHAFFIMANDPHMAKTCSDVKHDFVEAYHALMEIDRQIISYINQIDQQNELYRKIRKLKYLQDQLLIKSGIRFGWSLVNTAGSVFPWRCCEGTIRSSNC